MRPGDENGQVLPRAGGLVPLGLIRALRKDMLQAVSAVAKECGDLAGFRFGSKTVLVLSSPELIRQVLVRDAASFPKGPQLLRALRPLLGQGLITSEGELHARQRKLIAPYFHPGSLDGYAEKVVALGNDAIARWPEGERIELVGEMHRLTMDLVGNLLLSVSIEDDPELSQAILEAFDWEMHALTHLLAPPLSVPTPRNLRMRAALSLLRRRLGAIIDERERAGGQEDLLSMLLSLRTEEGEPLPRQQVYDEALTLCGAAQESSADALAWTKYLLATNPAAYDRLREEVDSVTGRRPVTAQALPELGYAARVFKEALRLYPPAAIMVRSAARDSRIGPYRVKRGSLVILAPWVVHRRPDLYPEPDRFEPDRFLPAAARKIPKCGYLPFGAGERVCIGNHLALMEGQLLTATFAREVEMALDRQPPVKPVLRINVRPEPGIWVRVRRRRG